MQRERGTVFVSAFCLHGFCCRIDGGFPGTISICGTSIALHCRLTFIKTKKSSKQTQISDTKNCYFAVYKIVETIAHPSGEQLCCVTCTSFDDELNVQHNYSRRKENAERKRLTARFMVYVLPNSWPQYRWFYAKTDATSLFIWLVWNMILRPRHNVWISIEIPLKFVLEDPINNNAALVQIMAWRRPGDKPLSKPMTISLLTHMCFTRP